MRTLMKQAFAARKAGDSARDVQQILAQGQPTRERLQQARQAMQQRIQGVLTPEQRAWLATNAPKLCDPATAPKLSDAQRTRMTALTQSFRQANRSDLEAVRNAVRQARAAHSAGESRGQIRSILQTVTPQQQRLATARKELRAQMDAVLTPEQRASRCTRPNRAFGREMSRGWGPSLGRMRPGWRRGS